MAEISRTFLDYLYACKKSVEDKMDLEEGWMEEKQKELEKPNLSKETIKKIDFKINHHKHQLDMYGEWLNIVDNIITTYLKRFDDGLN